MSAMSWATIWQNASSRGRQDFLVLPNRRFSYAETQQTIREFCELFDSHGLQPGDRIVLCTQNELGIVAAFLAAMLDGLVPTNLDVTTKARRGRSVLRETQAKLLIADPDVVSDWDVEVPVEPVAKTRERRMIGLSRTSAWPMERPAGRGREPRCPDDDTELAYLLFTSGSTSDPSGVMLTRRNLFANLESVGRVTDVRSGDRLFNDSPMAHTDGIMHGPVLAYALGATVVRAGGFQLSRLEDWLDTIGREGCSQVLTTPFVWAAICRYAEHDDYFSAPEMRLLISSAARLDLALWDMVEKRFGKPLANEYGMTETVLAAFHAGPLSEMGARGSIGLPAHCEARIDPIDTAEEGCGELQLRGAAISPGYWNNPERTAATRTQDGWFRTGDIARLRPDGSYDLVGRAKSMINSAGLRIHPAEIDEVIASHPDVRGSVTVGLPDDDFGEIAVTAVETVAGVSTSELVEYARLHLEPMKVPKRIVAVDEIPRTVSGKPRLAETVELLAAHAPAKREDSAAASPDRMCEAAVLAAAAEVFVCDPADLTLDSTQDSSPGWDSFSQLRLFLQLEETLEIRIPARKLAAIRTLRDLAAAVKESL